MLLYILIALAVIVIGLLIVISLQPSSFKVERSTMISAPPSAVFAQVDDFHNWDAWSPWAKLDVNMKKMFDGPSAGTGAGMGWSGNSKAGEGHMTITQSRPHELIRIKLDFVRPFKSTSTAEFTFKPAGNQTQVNWNMLGEKTFLFKAFGMFMNMDKMIGGDFERGLAAMKTVTEANPPK